MSGFDDYFDKRMHDPVFVAEYYKARIGKLKAENEKLKELIYDLRGYTRDWDWKYGAEWDKVMEELGIGSSTEAVDAEGE